MSEHPPQPDPAPGTPPGTPPAKAPPPSSEPPRAVSVKLLVGLALIVAVSVAVGVKFGGPIAVGARGVMGLIGLGSDRNQDAQAVEDEGGIQYYTCGMHPWVILPKPGFGPICGMPLVPLDPAKFTGEIAIDPLVVQNIGVRVAQVVTGPLVRTIRTVGTVDYDEPRVRDVNIKVNGWIEKLYVDYLGKEVTQGQDLFSLYSPELYSAQEEYLLAYRNRDKIGADFVPDAAQGAADLLDAARTRLLYYDITPQQIQELERSDKPTKTMILRSPHTGVVIQKHANEGMKVNPGMRVYRIADLSRVWVLVTLYEYQLPFVQLDQNAVMTLPYIPGQRFEGKVIYIYPYLDTKTREVQVRLEFDNANGLLKPGMFTNIELKNTLARERTLAPREAIIDTGERQVAFVSLGEGKFEPRVIRMGIETDNGMVEIYSGLEPGEWVVTSGQFLIDSEANMREALAKMVRGDMAVDQKPKAETAGASQLTTLPPPVAETLNDVLDAYFKIGDGLTADSIDNLADQAQRIADGLGTLTGMQLPEAPHFWSEHEEANKAQAHAIKLSKASDIEEARLRFADLSIVLGALMKTTGVPPSYPREIQELHCPMYRQGQGGSMWLQLAGDVRNPFLGSAMPTCFDQRTTLPVTGNATTKPQPPATQPPAPPAGEPSAQDPPALPADAQKNLDAIVTSYLSVQALLAEDTLDGTPQHLAAMRESSSALAAQAPAELAELATRVGSLSETPGDDLAAFRDSFAALSDAVAELARQAPPTDAAAPGLYLAYCPMVQKSWLQSTDQIQNPYGKSMTKCGTVKEQIHLVSTTQE